MQSTDANVFEKIDIGGGPNIRYIKSVLPESAYFDIS